MYDSRDVCYGGLRRERRGLCDLRGEEWRQACADELWKGVPRRGNGGAGFGGKWHGLGGVWFRADRQAERVSWAVRHDTPRPLDKDPVAGNARGGPRATRPDCPVRSFTAGAGLVRRIHLGLLPVARFRWTSGGDAFFRQARGC